MVSHSRFRLPPRSGRWRYCSSAAMAGFLACPAAWAQNLEDNDVVSSVPLSDFQHRPASGEPVPLFESMPPEKTGVGMNYPVEPDHELARLYPFGWAAGGVAIGDLNGDGKADLFFAGGPAENRLYLQVGDFQFFDVTAQAGVTGDDAWCTDGTMADIDNDGDLDLYLTCYQSPNLLFINHSKGNEIRFEEKGEALHLSSKDGSLNAGFADFDRDGALDVYLQTYHLEPESGRPTTPPRIALKDKVILMEDTWSPYYIAYAGNDGRPAWREAGRPDYLLRNKGFSFFEDFSEASRMALGRTYGMSLTWCDIDHDGFPDLYLGNDENDPDLFYRNSQRRTLTQIAEATLPHTPWFTRGTVVADFNNDLLVDILSANAGGESASDQLSFDFPRTEDRVAMLSLGGTPQVFRNHLLINTGAARFVDVAPMAGLAFTGASWSTKAGDFDNDGRLDAFFTNGTIRDAWAREFTDLRGENLVGKTRWDRLKDDAENPQRNRAFRNAGSLQFEDVSEAWGLDHLGMSYGAAIGDLDGDGDLDLVVCNAGETVSLYRNHSVANRIRLRLEGKRSNTWGIGAEVMIATANGAQVRQLYPQSGFLGSDEPVIHFGLGQADKVDRLTITWPSGAVETLENLEANRSYSIREAASLIPPLTRAQREVPMFAKSDLLARVGRQAVAPAEAPQPMAPPLLRRLGPAQAWADLDGDGKAELFLGGSRGRAGRFITQSPALSKPVQPFAADAASEDLGAVFFDADNDGDLDLYVASGGAYGAEAEALRDRLYLNDGLTFRKASPDHLPDLKDSTGPVAAADFDRDGDIDLFAGSRLVPGAYPTSPMSRLLINDGRGHFDDREGEELAPGLAESGMITGALWSDIDGDGWLDLLLTEDWGPIHIWRNNAGKLVNITPSAGTAELRGRWNGIAGGDIDQDGDIDYVITNSGLNTGSEASPSQPLPVFYGDLTSDGFPLLLETRRDRSNGQLIPAEGFDAWKTVVPDFEKIVVDRRQFAELAQGLDSIFTAERRSSALQKHVTTLESGLLINEGDDGFRFLPFPRIVQTAPAFGAVLTDANLDGRLDCYLVQNRETPYHAADPADNGVSFLLLGTGNPTIPFQPVWADESGLLVPGLGRSVTCVDLDGDDRPDFVVGISDGAPEVFLNEVIPTRFTPIQVELDHPDHLHAAGARVTISCEGIPDQVREYHAGSGYLSQSPATFHGVVPKGKDAEARVSIRWPDGAVTERTLYLD